LKSDKLQLPNKRGDRVRGKHQPQRASSERALHLLFETAVAVGNRQHPAAIGILGRDMVNTGQVARSGENAGSSLN
jgi:hypothetical protein